MAQQNAQEIKEKIVLILRRRGPSLPVHVAKETELTMLFASAFLSELYADKRIKISNMKVGGSPLYYLPGQEPMLERFSNYLNNKEKEAFEMIYQKRILNDSEQQPAIRVALRAIRDFAIPFKNDEQIYWRYLTVLEEEVRQIFGTNKLAVKKEKAPPIFISAEESKKPEVQEVIVESQQIIQQFNLGVQQEKPTKKEIKQEIKEDKKEDKIEKKKKEEFKKTDNAEKPLITIKPQLEKKPKPKSSFVLKVQNFLTYKDIELLEEKMSKKREFEGIARINSDLGKVELYVIAKEKKKVTENDLTVAVQKSHSNRRIVLFLSDGSLDKKAEAYLEKYDNIVKFLKI